MPATTQSEHTIAYLLADVSRLLRRDFDRRVKALKLTQAQWRAIIHLAREEGINQATLAERLEVKPITLGRLIDRMQAAGWVKRKADAADRRVSLLFLTDKAQPVLDEMHAHADEAMQNLLGGVPRKTQVELENALTLMKQNLADADAAAALNLNPKAIPDVRKQRKSKRQQTR